MPAEILLAATVGVLGSALAVSSSAQTAEAALASYRAQLQSLRSEFGGGKKMPTKRFFLFGMGNRKKLIYRDGQLLEALNGHPVRDWKLRQDTISPSDYRVELVTEKGELVTLQENESGVWVEEKGSRQRIPGTEGKIVLPSFEGFKYDQVLRVLHNEILINVLDGKPLPNFLVYKNPWRRDAAMMAMCLQKTGNLELIRDWVLNIRDPYDHNNKSNGAPENEADNLGQTLYLVSLFSDKAHPAVDRVLKEIPRFLVKDGKDLYIKGRSDFHFTPLYQTKWLKFGLKSLGLNDPYSLPEVDDDYSSLFWWDYRLGPAGDDPKADDYPYLGWARDHFHGKKRNPVSDKDYPLTWEIKASQANYEGMRIVDPQFVAERNSMPHSWHAAEAFLYLLEMHQ